jgi:hypothetical protein
VDAVDAGATLDQHTGAVVEVVPHQHHAVVEAVLAVAMLVEVTGCHRSLWCADDFFGSIK